MTDLKVLGFDLETYPIGPKRSPKVICGAFNIHKDAAKALLVDRWSQKMKDLKGRAVYFFHADKIPYFIDMCTKMEVVVAHNGAFDWSCISAMSQGYMSTIFEMFSRRILRCTYIRTLTYLNAYGQMKSVGQSKQELEHGKYGTTSYVGATYLFLGRDLSELKNHEVQVTYYKVEGKDFDTWPEDYRTYLIQDVEHIVDLYFAQEAKKMIETGLGYEEIDIFKPSPRRACFHYTLTLASAWGLKVDRESVEKLRDFAKKGVESVAQMMVDEGLAVPKEGKALEKAVSSGKMTVKLNVKAVQDRVEKAYEALGKEVPMTAKGSVGTDRRCLVASEDPTLVQWADVGGKRTIWSTFVPALQRSFDTKGVLNTSYFPYSETGRVSARSPNLLNPPRVGGVRDCIVAREGCCFVFCDYEGNELRVLAQVLLDRYGSSTLANQYAEDSFFDPHTYMACKRLGIDYEEGKALKKKGDKEFKKQRQIMKCCNFGFPGGMAPRTFIAFAKGYNVTVDEAQAKELKNFFLSQFPMIKKYLKDVGRIVKKGEFRGDSGGMGYQHRAGIVSGDRRYCQLANFYFQSLAAEGGLTAFAVASRKAYTDPTSALYGTRPVLFVHDEIIIETPIDKAHEAAMELQKVMEETMRLFTPDVPSVAEPTLATKWWKDAYQKFDEEGRLVPSDIGHEDD